MIYTDAGGVMYINLVKSKTSRRGTMVYLAEGYRVNGKCRHRNLKCYGYLEELQKDEPGVLERLKTEARKMTEGSLIDLVINLSAPLGNAEIPLNFGYFCLDAIYSSLGISEFLKNENRKTKINYDLDQIMKLLVFSRIMNPASKKEAYERKNGFFNLAFDFSMDDMYRSLTRMQDFKEELELWIHNQIKAQYGRDATLVFYDVTNYYFETEREDDDEIDEESNKITDAGLRKKGVSKEHRPEPIIQMGLFIDSQGLPIAYKLFPGNMNDKVTLVPVLEAVKEKYRLGRTIVVADKGLNSGNNLLYIRSKGNGYIVSQPIRKQKKEMIETVLDANGYVGNPDGTFKMKDWLSEREIKDRDGNIQILKEKTICFWSKEFEEREKYKREGLEESIAKFQKNPALYTASNSFGVKKYLKEKELDKETGEIRSKHPVLIFDEEKYRRDCALDGYYMLVTSKLDLTNEEILDKYRGLWKIEDSFRIIKSDLEGRPVYVRTKDHIEAHFLTCFIALVIMRLLQNRLANQYSAEQIKESLNRANAQLIDKGIYLIQNPGKPFNEISASLNFQVENKYIRFEKLKNLHRDMKLVNITQLS